MHTRRLASLLLGAWLMGGLLVAFVTYTGGQTAEALLASPPAPFQKVIDTLGGVEEARPVVRYALAEFDRTIVPFWEYVEIGLGAALIIALIFGMARRWLPVLVATLMVAITIFIRIALTPELIYLGRILDFLPIYESLEQRTRQNALHTAHLGLQGVTLFLGLFLMLYILRFKVKRKWRPKTQREMLEELGPIGLHPRSAPVRSAAPEDERDSEDRGDAADED